MRLPRFARITIWLAPMALFIWVAQQNLALFGSVTIRCTADHCARQLRGLAPKERETVVGTRKGTNERYMIFSSDPLSFDVSLVRSMRAATVRMIYQDANPGNRLKVALSSKGGPEYTAELADTSELIGILESGWNAVRGDGMTLFQKRSADQRVYTSVEEFLRDLPDLNTVGVYRADLSPYVSLPSYTPSAAAHTDRVTLRGNHTLLTYLGKNEDLDIQFTMQEANRNRGKDDVLVEVYRNDTAVYEEVLPDDGDQRDSGVPAAPREYRLRLAKPGEGQYRIVFTSESDDSFIRLIVSPQKYLVWDKELYLAGSSEYQALGSPDDRPLTVYVRGTKLTATTTHDRSLQTIKVGSLEVDVTKRLVPVTVNLDPSAALIPVTVPKQDLVLETDGAFVFTPSAYFSLYPPKMGQLNGVDNPAPYAYVLARYTPAVHDGPWLVAEHRFDPAVLSRNVHVAVRGEPPIAPGQASIRAKEIAVTFSGRPVTFNDLIKGVKRMLKIK